MQKHIPIIDIKIGGKKLKFGIDTGTEVNLISDHKFKELSKKDYIFLSNELLHGANKGATTVKRITIKNTKTAQNDFKNMSYVASIISSTTCASIKG